MCFKDISAFWSSIPISAACCNEDKYGKTCDSFNECLICDESIASGDKCSLGAGDTYCLDSEKDDCDYCPDDDKYNNYLLIQIYKCRHKKEKS